MSRASGDIASTGRLLRRKVLLALTLSSLVPLLVLAYVVYRYVRPDLHPSDVMKFYGLHALLLFTVLAMVGGAYIIWDLGRAFAKIAELLSREPKLAELGGRSDEVGTLMRSFSNMLGTVEQQAIDINTFAMRLDAAYRELEATNAKLKETSFKDEVASLPDDEASTSEELFRAADGALYAAKRAGKNQVVAAGPGQKVD